MKVIKIPLSIVMILLTLIGLSFAVEEDVYVVGPGDELDITVWNEPSLTKVFAVSKHGALDLPILGELKVDGLNVKQISELIAQKLKDGQYILEPQGNALVKNYRSQKVMIFGMVGKPGLYYLKGKTTILELVSELGGATVGAGTMLIHRKSIPADFKEAKPEQKGSKAESKGSEDNLVSIDLHALLVQGDLSQDIQILPGDLIYVGEGTKQTIYILGEVKKPGPYPFAKGITILKAIEMAGGFTDYASQARIKIVREDNGQKKNLFVRMPDIQKGNIEKDIELKKGDVVVVPQSWF